MIVSERDRKMWSELAKENEGRLLMNYIVR